MTMTYETWKYFPASKTVQISNFGNMRKKVKGSWIPFTPTLDGGYLRYSGQFIHRTVARLFIGNIVNMDVHHIDENKLNNHFLNLQIISHREHSSHHNPVGQSFHNKGGNSRKATLEECREIRRLYYKTNTRTKDISSKFPQFKYKTVNGIINCIDGYYEDFDDPIYDAVYYADKPHIVNTYDGGRIQKWRHPNK